MCVGRYVGVCAHNPPLPQYTLWFLKNIGINVSQIQAVTLLGIYPKYASPYHKDNIHNIHCCSIPNIQCFNFGTVIVP